jgi:hypothetical protein
MADDVIYKTPGEVVEYVKDFTELLPNDTSIGSSSASAVDAGGSNAAIIGSVTDSGMEVTVPINATTEGEDYTVTIIAPGGSSGETKEWILEVRSRKTRRGPL